MKSFTWLLKKLLKGSISKTEEKELLKKKAVVASMEEIWGLCDIPLSGPSVVQKRIWKNIERQMASPKRYSYKRIVAIAACFIFLTGLSVTLFYKYSANESAEWVHVYAGIQQKEVILLPDGSEVYIGPGSTLSYPSYFKKKERSVHLDGQAFFDVIANPDKPFTVQTYAMEITVKGTSFEVFSYKDEKKSEAILLTGSIDVSIPTKKDCEKRSVLLSPNQKIRLNNSTGEIDIETVDADKYSSWRSQHGLSFENEKLTMILPRLEKWYGVWIICDTQIAEKYLFTFKVREEPIQHILTIMSNSSSICFKEENGNYMLYEK